MLDKPLRDHNLLQAVARTNRPLPAMDKRTGIVVDYFGVFQDLEKALNFDENTREEALIDWDALKATVPGAGEVRDYLTHLAVSRNVAFSTQNQALSAILFLYRDVLTIKLDWIEEGWQGSTQPD